MGSNGTHKNKTYLFRGTALVPRNQRKKPEFNPSYGCGAMSKNASKCAHACAFGAFPHIVAHCSVTVTRIQF